MSSTEAPAAIEIPAGCASRFVFGLWSEMTSFGEEPIPPRVSDFTLAPEVMRMVSLPGLAIVTSQDAVGVPLLQLALSPKLPSSAIHEVALPGLTGQGAAAALPGRRTTAAIANSPTRRAKRSTGRRSSD